MPAERNGRFGAIARERKEPFTGPARQQYSQRVSHVHLSCPRSPMLFSNKGIQESCRYPVLEVPFGRRIPCVTPERRRITQYVTRAMKAKLQRWPDDSNLNRGVVLILPHCGAAHQKIGRREPIKWKPHLIFVTRRCSPWIARPASCPSTRSRRVIS